MSEPASAPKYLTIASEIQQRIVSGAIPIGGQLPTKQDLQAEFSAALNTVDRALDVLRDRGLVETRHGVGTFVVSTDVAQKAQIEERVAALESQVAELYEQLRELRNASTEKHA
ncbi:GntR family transcriptional regulator [Nocardia sp. NPDC059246]|uniref:GntR family transcriptional regulator n=1 Tax=unclassified Nocardia TaxID=2637762 RepID=UPI0036B583A6